VPKSTNDLTDDIDAAVGVLLGKAKEDGSVADLVRAIDTATKWAEQRAKLHPPEKGSSKFEQIKRKQLSRTARGGGTAPEAPEADE
jgi:hypothetical protein